MICTTNTQEARDIILTHAQEDIDQNGEGLSIHLRLEVDFEHGQNFVTCLDCGAQWSVHDVGDQDYDPDSGEEYQGTFDFEEVSQGDEYCLDLTNNP
jgi:hypothetical protein